jgi:3-oxoacyl-[acyl-carrier-protein] synthase III
VTAGLDILGTGIHLPPATDTRMLCQAAGADTSGFRGWRQVCIARDDEHPGTMGAAALRAALDDARVPADQLSVVISAGMSRDYPPSWSLSTEIMRAAGAPDSALGIDLTLGCLGTLAALNVALGWLTVAGGGYAAIVTAERWAYTVDRSSTATMTLWAHSDGAGALVVGLNTGDRAQAVYQGAEFVSAPEMNGRVLIKYGGTRYPVAPAETGGNYRQLSASPSHEVRDRYVECYTTALAALHKRFGIVPARLVCNQITPGIVRMLTRLTGLGPDAVVVSGDDVGHIGPADVIVGLHRLTRAGQLDGPVAVASSTPYSFGFGLVTPPASPAAKPPESRGDSTDGRASHLPPVRGRRGAHVHPDPGRQAERRVPGDDRGAARRGLRPG